MPEHKLKTGSDIIATIAAVGEALEYIVRTESPVEQRAGAAAVDVAWFAEDENRFPTMIFEVESSASNSIANNPAKVFGQPTAQFERPLFFFHVIVKSGAQTSRIEQLRGVFGQHNYRVYPLEEGTATNLVKDILQQHRRIRHTVRVGALTSALLNGSSLATEKLSIIEFAAELGLTGRYVEDLGRLAQQIPEAKELFLAHLRHRICDSRWPKTDLGYTSFMGSEWSYPIHLAILFASNVDLRDNLFAGLRSWQQESSYMTMIGPHFGLSRDYDDFMFALSGALWALIAALMCDEAAVCSYIAEQIWLTVDALGKARPPLWYQSAAWGIHIAASANDEEAFGRFRSFVNSRGGIPETILYSPPMWFDFENEKHLELPEGRECDVPEMRDFKLCLRTKIQDNDVPSPLCAALDWLLAETPETSNEAILAALMSADH